MKFYNVKRNGIMVFDFAIVIGLFTCTEGFVPLNLKSSTLSLDHGKEFRVIKHFGKKSPNRVKGYICSTRSKREDVRDSCIHLHNNRQNTISSTGKRTKRKLQLYNEDNSYHIPVVTDLLTESNIDVDGSKLMKDVDTLQHDLAFKDHSITVQEKKPSDSIEPGKRRKRSGVGSITRFAIPAIGVWLCGPLLSLIDTAIVGLFAGTNHQAALSPAVAVTDYAALLLAFLFAATTNLVSSANSASSKESNSSQTTLISSLQLSIYVGAVLGISVFAYAKPMLRCLIGNDAIDPKVFLPAVQYVRIRAVGMPAAAVLGSAQAACLGLKDIRSPLLILGAAAGINLVGDLIFVGSKYSLFSGAAGAAWATIISQYAAVVFFLQWLKSKPASKKTKNDSVSTKGFLHLISHTKQRFRKRQVLHFPTKKDALAFLPYLVPVSTTSIGRVSLFLAMAHVVSSCMGALGMAAQQIAIALFEVLCPIADSLSITAQSFVPTELAKEQNDPSLATMTKDFIKTGSIFGAVLVAITSCVPLITQFFTNDVLVRTQVNSIAPYLAGFFAMHGNVMAAEGVLLGRRDLGFLGWMYGIYFALVPAIMFRAKRTAIATGKQISLEAVWKIFLGYQLSRMTLWVGRALWLTRKKSTTVLDQEREESSKMQTNFKPTSEFCEENLMAVESVVVEGGAPVPAFSDCDSASMGRNETIEIVPCPSV